MSQSHDIYHHLYNIGALTALEALKLYGCFRLASRINDLRREGHNITTITIENNGKRYASYILEKNKS